MSLLDRVAARASKRLDWPLAPGDEGWQRFWVAPPSAMRAAVGSTTRQGEEAGQLDYESVVRAAYKSNGIVFACATARAMPFSEARFLFQENTGGTPGRLHDGGGSATLAMLDHPFGPTSTTGNMLTRMEQDNTNAGNAYLALVNGKLRRLRPDWLVIITGSSANPGELLDAYDINADVVGYLYRNPHNPNDKGTLLTPNRIVHYAPQPDPEAQWRGMSWLTPVLREVEADQAMTAHKRRFMRNGALLNVVVRYDKSIKPDDYERFVALFDSQHAGDFNAYKTLHLGGGSDATVVGSSLEAIDFKNVQGAGETRIAAAAGVGAVMAQLSEGMQGSALNAGNYSSARRRMADMLLRPLWREAAASLSNIAPPPAGSRLWYDVRDVAFLHDDSKDEAEVLSANAQTMKALVEAGYEPDSVRDAILSGDLAKLKHTGMFSVQLQKPGGVK